MQITLKLYGNLKKYSPDKKEAALMEVESGTTVTAMLEQLHVPDNEVWMSAVNDLVVPPATVLHDRDLVEVFEPVGGGA